MKNQFVIMDKTATTGKDYLDAELNNVFNLEDAKIYDTKESAKKMIERWEYHMEKEADWAIIVEL